MFLEVLKRKNPQLLKAAEELHREGVLEPNTYVIDGDAVEENARIIKQRADECGLTVYPMTKQIGYNPVIHEIIGGSGHDSFVAVDWMGARTIREQGFRVGHVGHLVQPPRRTVQELVDMRPELMTVFSVEKAREIHEAAKAAGVVQNILLRVYEETDRFYPGHEGGFSLKELKEQAKLMAAMDHLQIVGTTCFPCLLFNEEKKAVLPTSGFRSAVVGSLYLRDLLGDNVRVINVPGTTSSDLFEMIAKNGGTHVEPGHGFTGTTPLATVRDISEKPAVVYLSEISHLHNGRGHMFGGGLYVDLVRGNYDMKALVGKEQKEMSVELIPQGGIDYYGYVDGEGLRCGDTVLLGFRPQIFVTRGRVAVLRGLSKGKAKVAGYYDANGRELK